MEEAFNKTRVAYLKRINFVLDFIEDNLESDLSLAFLSKKAYYSPFHFHRVFSTIIGESLNQYINRKRVERIASILLTGSNKSIKELAYRYGFKSESSFSRTFKKYYGITPTTFKSTGKSTLSKIGIAPFTTEKYICSIDNIKNWISMNAQIMITALPEIQLAGIMYIGEFEKIGGMYKRLMEWGHKKEVLTTSNFKAITVYHDNPNITQPAKVRYSACVTINQEIEAEGDIRPLTIKKGIYMVGRFEIKGADISKAWNYICIWVLENGYEFRDGEYFEIYHNDHTTHPEEKFILDICIPLEKTDNIQLDRTTEVNLSNFKESSSPCDPPLTYHELIKYMKELSTFFKKAYDTDFTIGKVYQGNPAFSYFSLTTAELKKQKLKFVIILNHQLMHFSICLSGQNKSIRKKYWELFKNSDWNKYQLAVSINDSLFIMDHMIVDNPDFEDTRVLTAQIEREALEFIEELRGVLE